jgi:hypothetical protein
MIGICNVALLIDASFSFEDLCTFKDFQIVSTQQHEAYFFSLLKLV